MSSLFTDIHKRQADDNQMDERTDMMSRIQRRKAKFTSEKFEEKLSDLLDR